jgi:hypothetical protein
MSGFAESFNLSAATAITLAHLSAASSHHPLTRGTQILAPSSCGPLRPGDLPERQYNSLLLRWLMNSISQKRVVLSLLRRAGLELPPEISV